MTTPFKPKQKLLFIGDSITDTGRMRPVGRRAQDGLGSGYVNMIDSLLGAAFPETPVEVINTGISGNRVTDLHARWSSDVLDLKPDWLSVMIGINDVWRQFDRSLDPDQVDAERYETVYRSLLEQTQPGLTGLVLMTPFFIESNRSDPMRKMMDAYGAITRQLAEQFDATFIDIQAVFDDYLKVQPTQSLCGDRVHPNAVGHMIIARAFLRGLNIAAIK